MNEGHLVGINSFSLYEIVGDDVLQCCQPVHCDSFADQIFHAPDIRTGDDPEKRLLVCDHDALEGQAPCGGDERASNAGQVVNLACDQSRCLHGAGQLDHINVEAMLFINARVFGNEERKKGQTEGGIAHPNFFELLGMG